MRLLAAALLRSLGVAVLLTAPLGVSDPSSAVPPAVVGAPLNRILWSVQAGIVLAAAGVGLLFAKNGVIEEVAQPPLGTMQVSLDGTHRHVQRLGEILVFHPLQVMPVDQHLVWDRQLFDRLLQPVIQHQFTERWILDGRLNLRPLLVIDVVEGCRRQLRPLA